MQRFGMKKKGWMNVSIALAGEGEDGYDAG